MATVGEAIAATLIAQWNVGTGGTQPDPIQYLVERPERDPNPTVADAIYVWLPLRRIFDPIDVAEVYRNVTYTIRIVCHTKTSSARQLEIENEVDRILNSGTVITGATRQRVKEINDISNRSYSNLPKYISEVIMEVFTAMEVSATAYGTATTTTLTTDDLIVNTSITGNPTAALGNTAITGTLSASGLATFTGEIEVTSASDFAAVEIVGSAANKDPYLIIGSDIVGDFYSAQMDKEGATNDNLRVLFKSYTTSVTADAGEYVFQYEGVDLLKIKPDGDVVITGDLTISGASPSITGTDIADLLMFGSANAAWVPCPFEIGEQAGKIKAPDALVITNVDGTNDDWLFRLPKPTNKGSLKLYVNGSRIGVRDADAAAYITYVIVYGQNHTASSVINNDATDLTSQQLKTTTFGAVDCSSYESVFIRVGTVVDAADELDITGLELRCYYAA